MEEEDGEAEEGFSFEIIMAYTLAVVLIALLAQRIWDAAAQGVELLRMRLSTQPGSLPNDAVTEEPERSLRDRHAFLATEEDISRSTEGEGQPVTQGENEEAPLPSRQAPLPDQHQEPPLPAQQSAEPSQAEASTATSSTVPMATPESPVDIMREWDEIEREERLIRAELNSVPPAHPILGPINSDTEEPELAVLPFDVVTTRYGSVYHQRRDCMYLMAPCTGPAHFHRWCGSCQRVATRTGRTPMNGAAMFMTGWGTAAHSDPTCPRAQNARTFACCTACQETNIERQLELWKFEVEQVLRRFKGGVQMSPT